MIMEKALNSINAKYADYQESDRLEILRLRINDENYLHAAIQRLALVMSNELMLITKEGGQYERKRRK
jgi:hypothetical protein